MLHQRQLAEKPLHDWPAGSTVRIFRQRTAPELADQVFRFRHRHFNGRLGWGLRTDGDREIDQFDQSETIHCALLWQGIVVGCWRALPTTGPYLLGDVFPVLLEAQPRPCDWRVWEITRFGLDTTGSIGRAGSQSLFAHMFAFGWHVGASKLVAVSDPSFERLMHTLGIRTRRYGNPRLVAAGGGASVQAVAGEIDLGAQDHPRFVSLQQLAQSVEIDL